MVHRNFDFLFSVAGPGSTYLQEITHISFERHNNSSQTTNEVPYSINIQDFTHIYIFFSVLYYNNSHIYELLLFSTGCSTWIIGFLFGICLEFVRRSEIFLVAMVILHMETKTQLNIQQICSLNIVCVA